MQNLESVNCNFCNSNDYKIKYIVDGFNYVQCNNCGLVYVNPRLSIESIEHLYDQNYFVGNGFDKSIDYKKDFEEKSTIQDLNVWDISTIKTFLPKNIHEPKLLDVGCGMGLFLWKAKNNGFVVEGIELSDYASEFAIAKGLSIKKGTIDSIELKNNFYDAIVMKEVIEHLTDPKKSLQIIFDSLKFNGVLFITTGNYNCPERIIKGKNWFYFMPTGHLQIFSNKTIKKYLEEIGFRKIYVTRQGDLLMNFLLRNGIIETDKFKPKNILRRIIFTLVRFINHFISSGMRIYAIK